MRIDIAAPEDAVRTIGPCDLFVCLYVFELLPSPEYGRRILDIAYDLLRPGGAAFIQIRYQTDHTTRPLRYAYRLNRINMTSYRLDAFWQLAADAGFEPQSISLDPRDDIVHDDRYAYFLLHKSPTTPNA